MSRFPSHALRACLVVSLLAASPSVRAATPEETLTRRGLKRSGVSYVMQDHEKTVAEQNQLTSAARKLEAEYRNCQEQFAAAQYQYQLLQQAISRLDSRIDSLKRKTFRDKKDDGGKVTETQREQERDRDSDVSQLKKERPTYERNMADAKRIFDLAQNRGATLTQQYNDLGAQYERLTSRNRKAYAALAADNEVADALKTLNAESKVKFVLGPVKNPKEYKFAMRASAAEELKDKGLVFEAEENRYLVKGEREVISLAHAVRVLNQGLTKLQKPPTPGSSRYDDLAKKARKLTDELARTDPSLRNPKKAELDLVKGQIKGLEAQGITSGRQEQERAAVEKEAAIAALTRELSEKSRTLRALADESEAVRKAIQDDPEIKDALGVMNANRSKSKQPPVKVVILPDYTRAIKDLETFEKASLPGSARTATGAPTSQPPTRP